jgi:N-acyl-D-aspartate/D-glutamate deacylase
MTLGRIKPEQLWPAEDVYKADGSLKMPAYQKLKSVDEAQDLVDGFLNKTYKKPIDSESISLTVWCNIVDPALTKLALKKPFVFMGNDGGVSKNRKSGKLDVQPRTYACFSRLIGHWSNSNDQDAISLKQALFKATIAPAMWLGLSKKGRLQEGCDADIVIFDKNTIKDRASAENVESLNLPPVGFSKVIVNGTVVVDNGELTGEAPGKLIRRTWKIEGNTKNVVEMYNKRFPSDS